MLVKIAKKQFVGPTFFFFWGRCPDTHIQYVHTKFNLIIIAQFGEHIRAEETRKWLKYNVKIMLIIADDMGKLALDKSLLELKLYVEIL